MNIVTVSPIKTAAGVAAIPVASTAEVFTPVFSLKYGDAFGVELLAAVSSGTPDIKVELYQSMDGINFVEPDGMEDVAILGDTSRHIKQVTPVPAPYGKFRLKGQGSNPASATVTILMAIQEQL